MASKDNSKSKRKSSAQSLGSRRKYKNPPIVEATCELLFAPVDDWNLAYTGLFLEKIKDRYAGKPREQRLLQLDTKRLTGSPVTEPAASVREITKVQFPTLDGKEMVAVGPGMLSVHVLKPYTGWEAYRPQIEEAVEIYRAIAKPTGIRRIGIRYINRIDLPDEKSDPRDYFAAPPSTLEKIDCALNAFVVRHEYVYPDSPIKLVVNMAKVETQEGRVAYVLDLDQLQEWPSEPLPIHRGMAVIDELRRREREAFEALITPRAQELFDA